MSEEWLTKDGTKVTIDYEDIFYKYGILHLKEFPLRLLWSKNNGMSWSREEWDLDKKCFSTT